MRKICLLACLIASPLRGQVPVQEGSLTSEAAALAVALYNAPETIRSSGDTRIASATEMNGDVGVLEGTLTLTGHIHGNLVIINGDLVADSGAVVDGEVTVIGGTVRGADHLAAKQIVWYRDRIKYELREGSLVLMREGMADELSAGRDFRFGRTDLVVSARGSYNRSEGLPILAGPRLTLGRRNPTRLEAFLVFRTAAGFAFGNDDYGNVFNVEQFVGGKLAAKVGVRYGNEIQPVEAWGLSNREASIAAFVLHRDYRDHFMQRGWTVFLAAGRTGLPLDWRFEYTDQTFDSAPLRDPFSVLHNHAGWRRELHVATQRVRALTPRLRYDTRNEDFDPASGWLVRAEAEIALSAWRYRYGLIDARRYARLTPHARLSLRAVAAGTLSDDSLPAFRQQALGGEASLPAYDIYDFDCGGHAVPDVSATPFYGCDRLLLLQLEYQSSFSALTRFSTRFGHDFGLFDNVRWMVFFDTGRSWTPARTAGSRGVGTPDFITDAGFGIRFGRLGAYWAVPLSARQSGVNFFMRLGPRL